MAVEQRLKWWEELALTAVMGAVLVICFCLLVLVGFLDFLKR